ncbi:MAG TPA: CHAT domain-containing protein [Caldilineaceae bacterium]|nr:CHAT domain-containing protein [Caldilineaceae bacterium]
MSNLPDYQTLELLIGAATPAGYPLTITQSPAGEATAHCRLDPADGELGDALAAVAAHKVDADFLTQVGTFLFEELFCGEIGQIYRTSLGMVRSQGHRLRVRLRIEPPELASLPWELLHDAQEEQSFAISPEVALVRYVPMRLPVRPSAVTLPLRLLVVLASPIDQPGLDVTTERRHIEEALQERVAKGEVQVTFLEAATVANLQQALRTVQPHIFHFVGHGIFDGERAQLVLEDEEDRSVLIDERIFRELFAGSSETRVAVLNACQTGRTSTVEPLVGLAPRLLQRQLSAVVAMQYAITDQAGLIFAREFYRSLAVGLPVDAAVDEARRGIWLELGAEQSEWAAPALFMRAADGQLFAVEKKAPTVSAVHPPPEPIMPPDTSTFVGRETELRYYAEQLTAHNLAVIIGMPGVGKTSLAAKLVQQEAQRQKAFWHSFRPEEGLDILVWKLAAFLAWQERPALWELLQGIVQGGGQLPPLDVLLDYLFQMLRHETYLICLDDFHYVDQDPLMELFAEHTMPLLQQGELTLVLTSHRVPDFARNLGIQPLAGMSRIDMARLLTTRGLILHDVLAEELYRHTEGNAEFLTISINALQGAKEPAQLIAQLTQADNIQHYLLNELDATLSEEERSVESTVAVLGSPSTRDAIEVTSDSGNLIRPLSALAERFLLTTWQEARVRTYGQHTILRDFYYDLLSRRQRQKLHHQAALYYEQEEKDRLKAAQHYFHAGDQMRCAQLITHDTQQFIDQGHTLIIRNLLEGLDAEQFDDLTWSLITITRGEVYRFLRQSEMAQRSFQDALARLKRSPDGPDKRRHEARACRGMGDVLAREAPAAALQWLQTGLELLNDSDVIETAYLLTILSYVLTSLGKFSEALHALEQALQYLPDSARERRAGVLLNQGIIYYNISNTEEARACWLHALELSQQSSNRRRMITLWINLGWLDFDSGHWNDALSQGEKALAAAKELGAVDSQAIALNLLGYLQMNLGHDELALAHATAEIELTEQHTLQQYKIDAQTLLAELHLRRKEPMLAAPLLTEAEQLAVNLQFKHCLPDLYRGWALFKLAIDDAPAALAYAERAVAIAQELSMPRDIGMSLRILGQAQLANQQTSDTDDSFTQSLSLLSTHMPFEAARTQAAWGEALLTMGQVADAIPLLDQAYRLFAELDAQRERMAVYPLLQQALQEN